MLNLNLERYGRFILNGVELDKLQLGTGEAVRAVPTLTAKAALATMTPTRVVRNLWDSVASHYTRPLDCWIVNIPAKAGTTYSANIFAKTSPVLTGFTVMLNSEGTRYSEFVGRMVLVNSSGGISPKQITAVHDYLVLAVYVPSGKTLQDAFDAFDVMLVEGLTSPTSYYPYFSPQTVLPHIKVFGKTEKRHIPLNLFDKTAITTGKYLDSTGSEVSNTAWNISDYMPVESGATYYQSISTAGVAPRTCWYATDKTFLSATEQVAGGTITAPSNAAYCRMCVYNGEPDTAMFTKGSTAPTEYIPYGIYELYGVGEKTEQLYDKTQAELGDIRAADGTINPLSYRVVSGFIPVNEGDTIRSEGTLYITDGTVGNSFSRIKAFYDADKAFITGSRSTAGASLEIPAGVKYARLEFYASNIDNTKTCDIERSIINIVNSTTAPSATVPIPYGYAINTLLGSQGVVDLGTLTWQYDTTTGQTPFFKTPISVINPKPMQQSESMFLDGYTPLRSFWAQAGKDKYVATGTAFLNISDSRYTDAASFKAAMSGVYLYYQRATDATFIPPVKHSVVLSNQLHGGSNYADSIDFQSGVYGHGAKVFVVTGEERWDLQQGSGYYRYGMSITGVDGTHTTDLICSDGKGGTSKGDWRIAANILMFYDNQSDPLFANVDAFKAAAQARYAMGKPYVVVAPSNLADAAVTVNPIALTEKAQYTLENTNTVRGDMSAEYLGGGLI